MSTTSNFSNGQFFDGQSSAIEGFTPLTSDQMDRMKGGFDLEDDPIVEDNDPEPVDEPIEGEIGGAEVAGG